MSSAGNYNCRSSPAPSRENLRYPGESASLAPSHPSDNESDPMIKFRVGNKWAVDWQSLFNYKGVMQIKQQIEPNIYLTKITISYLVQNKKITVFFDGLLTINGENVVIRCSDASVSWWNTDDFYLEWHNDTMTGYNVDKKGRRGKAVFKFVEYSSSTSPLQNPPAHSPSLAPGASREQQLALSQELFDQGRRLFKENNFPEAIEKLQASIKLNHSRAWAQLYTGPCL